MKRKKTWLWIPLLSAALMFATAATADSSDLDSALGHLQSARNALERGARKGAHRKPALQAVNQAIAEVRKGLEDERRKERKVEKRGERQERKAEKREERQEDKAARQEERDAKKAAKKDKKAEE